MNASLWRDHQALGLKLHRVHQALAKALQHGGLITNARRQMQGRSQAGAIAEGAIGNAVAAQSPHRRGHDGQAKARSNQALGRGQARRLLNHQGAESGSTAGGEDHIVEALPGPPPIQDKSLVGQC